MALSNWTPVAPRVKVALGQPMKRRLRTFLASSADHPLHFAVEAVEQAFVERRNSYDLFMYMHENDPNLQGIVEIGAGLVSTAYRGVTLNADGDLDVRQQYMLKVAQHYEKKLNFKGLHYQLTKKLKLFGNCVLLKVRKTEDGYPKLRELPITHVTILQRRGQLWQQGSVEEQQVWKANYYVLNEQMDWNVTKDGEPIVMPAEDIVHVQLSEGFDQVDDSMSRYTYGVWSKSPFRSVVQTWWWKQEIIWADMLVREQTLPIQQHKLDLDWMFEAEFMQQPEGDTRTPLEYIMEMQNQVIESYIEMNASRKPDEPIVTTNRVDIEIHEPSAVTYLEANEVLEQLDRKHAAALGVPISVISPTSSSFASDVIRTSHSAVTTDRIIEVIKEKLLGYLKEVLLEKYPGYAKQIKELDFTYQLSLDKDQDMMMRRAAVGDSMKIFHPDELRTMAGFPNLLPDKMKEEMKEFYTWREGIGNQQHKIGESGTSSNVAGQSKQNKSETGSTLQRPNTSQSKKQQQQS